MPDIGMIAGAIGALKGASEIVSGLIGVRDQAILQAKVIDLQRAILEAMSSAAAAQSQQMGMMEELRGLREQIEAFEDWKTVETRYVLKDFGSQTFAYQLKEATSENPAHLACPTCFGNRQRSILQFQGDYGGQRHFKCHSCKDEFQLGTYSPPPTSSADSDWSPFA